MLVIENDQQGYPWYAIIFISIHLIVIFMILFNLRKFVINSVSGNALDKSTRKYLKLAGIFSLIYGGMPIFNLFGIISYFKSAGGVSVTLVTDAFFEVGKLCFLFVVGLFFLYLSNVLQQSEELKQENQLTI